jgi:hypothetical protein
MANSQTSYFSPRETSGMNTTKELYTMRRIIARVKNKKNQSNAYNDFYYLTYDIGMQEER